MPLRRHPIPTMPFESIAANILGPFQTTTQGNRYVLPVKDFTTRYALLESLPNKDTDNIIASLRNILSNFGSPEVLLTDNAPEFKSEKMMKYCKFYNIKKAKYSSFHPMSGGLCERHNKEINKLVQIYVSEIETLNWDEFLPTLQLTMNSTFNEMLEKTPLYCLFGYDSPSETLKQPLLNYQENDLSYPLNEVANIRHYAPKMLLKTRKSY